MICERECKTSNCVIVVEELEGLEHLLLGVPFTHLLGHQVEKVIEIKLICRRQKELHGQATCSTTTETQFVLAPSLSTSAIIFLISSFLGSKPRARIATLSSFASMMPVPLSNSSNACLISDFCSSFSSSFPVGGRFRAAMGGCACSLLGC
eukprot:m.55607 g.55607  ORF g.55607 m.55607 type:complete len:151 (-) comp48887_c0_seq4:129-581(-)